MQGWVEKFFVAITALLLVYGVLMLFSVIYDSGKQMGYAEAFRDHRTGVIELNVLLHHPKLFLDPALPRPGAAGK